MLPSATSMPAIPGQHAPFSDIAPRVISNVCDKKRPSAKSISSPRYRLHATSLKLRNLRVRPAATCHDMPRRMSLDRIAKKQQGTMPRPAPTSRDTPRLPRQSHHAMSGAWKGGRVSARPNRHQGCADQRTHRAQQRNQPFDRRSATHARSASRLA